MSVIAVEEHFASAAILNATGGRDQLAARNPLLARDLTSLGDRRLGTMDEAGIGMQLISHSATPSITGLPGPQAVSLSVAANDELAAAIATHPTRFSGLALLPTNIPEAAADELERAVAKLGFAGGIVHGHTHGAFLDDPRFGVLLERFAALDVPLYLHPAAPVAAVEEAYYDGLAPGIARVLSTNGWGWHAETALHVLRMTMAGTFDRHPQLQLVIGHMGEMLPFMLARIDSTLGPLVTGLDRSPSETLLSHLHISTSALLTLPPLICALLTFGVDRILFGIDWPFTSNEAGRRFLDTAPVASRDLAKISHLNSERVFRLGP